MVLWGRAQTYRPVVESTSSPVYEATRRMFTGKAVGGPKSGEVLTNSYLTFFVREPPVQVPGLKPSKRPPPLPSRYDYDLETSTWVYVEYTPAPLGADKGRP